MIDEMYDRAWGEHRQRFSQDISAVLRKAGRALQPASRRRMSSDAKPDIRGLAQGDEERVDAAVRFAAADVG